LIASRTPENCIPTVAGVIAIPSPTSIGPDYSRQDCIVLRSLSRCCSAIIK
jgi:hypothetical protein